MKIEIPCSLETKGLHACAVFSIPYEWPDMYSPQVMAYHRKMIQSYADVGLAGVCLDEWGLPVGDAALAPTRLWYSKNWASVYARRTGRRDLLRDLLLMSQGESGRENQRLAAINHYMEMIWQGNAAIEENFYKASKATFGPAAFVGTHPTWWPYPDAREVSRNGLDWWAVPRDWAQVDEVTPFCVRTALAKKWGSPIWYNMFYSRNVADYEKSLWTHALGGGRINYHPAFPFANARGWNYDVLLQGGLMQGECRVRLLNFISRAPLDCPVAVIFGHAAATNWVAPGLGDTGVPLCDALWKEGYYADLIPSSEISSGALKIAADGHIQYGPQRYSAVVLYQPQYGGPEVAEFFRKAAQTGKTALYRVGDWTMDFGGEPVRGNVALPAQMTSSPDAASAAAAVVDRLRRLGVAPQEPATGIIGWDRKTAAPPAQGRCRLIDGTVILVAGEKSVTGDPIQTTLDVNGRKVAFDAMGVAAMRLNMDGKLEAMAAGGLKSFEAPGVAIELAQRADVALWRDGRGQMHGVLQGWTGPVPGALAALTDDWLRLTVPVALDEPKEEPSPIRLPHNVPPVIGAWFPEESEMQPEGYRNYLDAIAEHSHYNLLTTTMRIRQRQMVDPEVHDWFKQAVTYARSRGIGVALDLDVRQSIPAFKKRYPEELQERLWLQEIDLTETGEAVANITYGLGHGDAICTAEPNAMCLQRAYSYVQTPQGIDPETVKDITSSCKVRKATARELSVAIACGAGDKGRKACVIARVTFDFPAVFGPHLLQFEADTIRQYADLPLSGLMKDEWGFPAAHDGNPQKNGYWFSRFQAEAYAKATRGRDLVRDTLLMCFGERGREADRQAAINQVMELYRLRNTEIEQTFYQATKATFGPDAFVGTHDTTFPYPDSREFERNGLNWWTATRDYAQSDEITPYCCRTSMAKKFGGPVWYNQWYASTADSYGKLIWSYALAGGRMNFHILYPSSPPYHERGKDLLRTNVPRGDCRIRLLNFISQSPVECPVAVIFGHACAMNWAGPAFDDVGTELTDAFWRAGYYADLIPSSEARDQALRVDEEGNIWYGRQRYAAVVLYHPEFETAATAEFFRKAATGKTILCRVGDWTKNFDARPFDGHAALPSRMKLASDISACANTIIAELRNQGIEPQTPATVTLPKWNGIGRTSAALPSSGTCRLIDGTVILASGEHDVMGDPIQKTLKVRGRDATFDAVGIAAVRTGENGKVEAMAAGGLKSFRTGDVSIELAQRADVALWRDANGGWQGVLQDHDGPVPDGLLAITKNWARLRVPVPFGQGNPLPGDRQGKPPHMQKSWIET
jgi:hypothetical protein